MSTDPIRRYSPSDLERLKEITVICFSEVSIDRNIEREFGLVGDRDWRWRKRRHIDADVDGDNARGVFVYETEGEVVGYITTRVDDESRSGWIQNMAVDPAHQGKGIGRHRFCGDGLRLVGWGDLFHLMSAARGQRHDHREKCRRDYDPAFKLVDQCLHLTGITSFLYGHSIMRAYTTSA